MIIAFMICSLAGIMILSLLGLTRLNRLTFLLPIEKFLFKCAFIGFLIMGFVSFFIGLQEKWLRSVPFFVLLLVAVIHTFLSDRVSLEESDVKELPSEEKK
jgi:hypothetical protein